MLVNTIRTLCSDPRRTADPAVDSTVGMTVRLFVRSIGLALPHANEFTIVHTRARNSRPDGKRKEGTDYKRSSYIERNLCHHILTFPTLAS
jgi:hypothetical protein